jgi:small conductance mechanosensitive channel
MQEVDLTTIFKNLHQINPIRIFLVVAVAWLLTKAVERLLPWVAKQVTGRLRPYILPSVPVLRLVILIGAIASIIPLVIEPTFQNLIAILGAVGLAVVFALRDYISSIVAGIVALYERPYRPGDWVQVDGAYGEVKSVGLRAFRLVTPDDTTVTIPNIKLWQTNVFNANDGKRDLMCVADFYLAPWHDAALVRQLLNDVVLTSPYVNLTRPRMVIVMEKPWGTNYKVKAYPVDGRDQFQFITDLTIRGKAALGELGIRSAMTWPVPVSDELTPPRS